MGWSIGYDSNHQRDIGYGVPAICDHPDCTTAIDRGLSYVCGGEVYGGDNGCGLFFCYEHLTFASHHDYRVCERCAAKKKKKPFKPKPDTPEWTNFKMTDPSWAEWRKEQEALKS